MSTIGLSPGIDNLDGFLASSGVSYLLLNIEYFDSNLISLPLLPVRAPQR